MATNSEILRVTGNGPQETLRMCLVMIKEETNPEQYQATVETLLKIFSNTVAQPESEKFRHLRKTNKAFWERVWHYDGAQQFMLAAGWIEVDESVVLPSDVPLTEAILLLEGEHRLKSQPDSSQPLTPEEVTKQKLIEEERRKREAAVKREKEERKRIQEQIKADRKDTSTRETKDSHAKRLSNGGKMTKFEDIGVDLSHGGG